MRARALHGDTQALGGFACTSEVSAGHDGGKLIATDASDEVSTARLSPQRLGDDGEHDVTRAVAE